MVPSRPSRYSSSPFKASRPWLLVHHLRLATFLHLHWRSTVSFYSASAGAFVRDIHFYESCIFASDAHSARFGAPLATTDWTWLHKRQAFDFAREAATVAVTLCRYVEIRTTVYTHRCLVRCSVMLGLRHGRQERGVRVRKHLITCNTQIMNQHPLTLRALSEHDVQILLNNPRYLVHTSINFLDSGRPLRLQTQSNSDIATYCGVTQILEVASSCRQIKVTSHDPYPFFVPQTSRYTRPMVSGDYQKPGKQAAVRRMTPATTIVPPRKKKTRYPT